MNAFQTAEEEFRRHPYFINTQLDALAEATPEERPVLLRRIAAAVGDEATLRTLLGIDPEEFASFYPDMMPQTPSTADTIDTFIDRFAPATPPMEEVPVAPAVEYAAYALDPADDDNEMPADSTSDAISAFLQSVPPKTPKKAAMKAVKHEENTEEKVAGQVKEEEAEEVQELPEVIEEIQEEDEPHPDKTERETPMLSEELARIMVKNGNYRKALEIITDLSLKNPKKSIYFADQMRFLNKLIENQQRAAERKEK